MCIWYETEALSAAVLVPQLPCVAWLAWIYLTRSCEKLWARGGGGGGGPAMKTISKSATASGATYEALSHTQWPRVHMEATEMLGGGGQMGREKKCCPPLPMPPVALRALHNAVSEASARSCSRIGNAMACRQPDRPRSSWGAHTKQMTPRQPQPNGRTDGVMPTQQLPHPLPGRMATGAGAAEDMVARTHGLRSPRPIGSAGAAAAL